MGLIMARFAGEALINNGAELLAGARNLREPFPIRQDLFRDVPTKKILDGDGNDKYPGFEIRQVMPRALMDAPQQIAQLTPGMVEPSIMDEDELELRDLGVPGIRSLNYEREIIKTPTPERAWDVYNHARPGGPF